MSTYSDAWHNMDPDIRNFYRNFADRNTAQSWHVEYFDLYDMWMSFAMFGLEFLGYLGYHIAQRNWGLQTAETGSFDSSTCLLSVAEFNEFGDIEPQYDIGNILFYGNIWDWAPAFCYNYPREKYRVRKSYWTGAPRRRRNL